MRRLSSCCGSLLGFRTAVKPRGPVENGRKDHWADGQRVSAHGQACPMQVWPAPPNAASLVMRVTRPLGQGDCHTPDQIIARLREAEAMLAGDKSIAQVCQHLEVSEVTYHR